MPGRVLVMCVNQCADQLPCSKPLLSRPLMACTACHVVPNKLRSAHDVESASVWQSLAAREAFVAVYAFPGHHKGMHTAVQEMSSTLQPSEPFLCRLLAFQGSGHTRWTCAR